MFELHINKKVTKNHKIFCSDESRVELVRGAVEGCASSSEKWKMDFGTLLADRQGVDAFRAYLEKEATDRLGSRLMTMWLIYEGISFNLFFFRKISKFFFEILVFKVFVVLIFSVFQLFKTFQNSR